MATFGTFVDNTTLKASELNGFLDLVLFEPVLRQSSAIATGVDNGYYWRVNKLVCAAFWTGIDGTGTAGQPILVDLPVTAATNSFRVIGTGVFQDSSANNMRLLRVVQYSTTRAAFLTAEATSMTAYFGAANGPNTAVGIGDNLQFTITYEAA